MTTRIILPGGGGTDATITFSDITTNDVSTSKHGFAPKAPNDVTKFLNGLGLWSVPTGGAMALLADSVAPGVVASFDMTSISGSYSHLMLVMQLRTDEVTTDDWGYLRFNNDSGANYDDNGYLLANAAIITVGAETGQTKMKCTMVMGTTAASGDAASVSVVIPNYAGTTFHKTFVSAMTGKGSSTRIDVGQFVGNWNNTAAITRITVLPPSGNFIAGSRVTLYGVL